MEPIEGFRVFLDILLSAFFYVLQGSALLLGSFWVVTRQKKIFYAYLAIGQWFLVGAMSAQLIRTAGFIYLLLQASAL